MKINNHCYIEEDIATFYSRERNEQLQKDFDECYKANCRRAGRKLTNIQNTALFVDGSITRLLVPPRTHYAEDLRRVGQGIYVSIKK